MIRSISKELCVVEIPHHEGEIKMLPFELSDLAAIPAKFRQLVRRMIDSLPIKTGTAFLTIDGKEVNAGQTQRRGGKHIDGNYLPELSGGWGGSGGGNGWKVGEGGVKLSQAEHVLSYNWPTGGMLITSTYPGCMGWSGTFEGAPAIGGDCAHIKTGKGFMLQPNVCYYGNSQFIHESLQIAETIHRTIVRITLPIDYPVIS